MSQYVTLKLKRGTSTEWSTTNPTLAVGEPGFETDTGKMKIGTGVTGWSGLPYLNVSGATGATGATGYNFSVPSNSILWTPDGTSITGTVGLRYASGVGITMDVLNIRSSSNKIAIGSSAGQTGQQALSVAIGSAAGQTNQQSDSVAVGRSSGESGQGSSSVAIGPFTGQTSQGQQSVAIGMSAGKTNQREASIAIGIASGFTDQGRNSIAIGTFAGAANQADNTIILNASGGFLNGVVAQTSSFYVNPIRTIVNGSLPSGFFNMAYNPTTSEIIYWS